MSCCDHCAADPVLAVVGCLPCVAGDDERNTETDVAGLDVLDPAAVDVDGALVGDAGEDFLRGFAAVDRGVGDFLDPLLRSNPYTSMIADVHGMRMGLLEQAAPEYYGPGAPGAARAATPRAPAAPGSPRARLAMLGGGMQAARAMQISPQQREDATIRRLKLLLSRAKDGDGAARGVVVAMRSRALAGDLRARREYAATIELARGMR